MANKYSKKNAASNGKTMEDYRNRQRKINIGAKVMAIVLIFTMVVFYVLSAGLSLFN